jgi:hypothetical protein
MIVLATWTSPRTTHALDTFNSDKAIVGNAQQGAGRAADENAMQSSEPSAPAAKCPCCSAKSRRSLRQR